MTQPDCLIISPANSLELFLANRPVPGLTGRFMTIDEYIDYYIDENIDYYIDENIDYYLYSGV